MSLPKLKNKHAAIELSVGTVVIIVLAMSMLILGIVLVRNIFSGATESITQIDQGVKNEINKLFSENQDRRLILFPTTGIIKLQQGSQDGGFAISIRNIEPTENKAFSYRVTDLESGSCGTESPISSGDVEIITGESEESIQLPKSSKMENPRHVRFRISNTAPTCTFRVKVTVEIGDEGTKGDTEPYQDDVMDIEIVPK